MSVRKLATGCALALLMVGPIASAAPRSHTASKSPTASKPPAPSPSLALNPAPRDQATPDAPPLHTRFAITRNADDAAIATAIIAMRKRVVTRSSITA